MKNVLVRGERIAAVAIGGTMTFDRVTPGPRATASRASESRNQILTWSGPPIISGV